MKTSKHIVRSSDIIGVKVTNIEDKNLGRIEEIVLDKMSGTTRYVVLSSGGFLGVGDKYFALPWEVLHYNPEKEAFILNISKEKLQEEAGFDKNNYPDFSDQTRGILL